jgi:hypothetical protein
LARGGSGKRLRTAYVVLGVAALVAVVAGVAARWLLPDDPNDRQRRESCYRAGSRVEEAQGIGGLRPCDNYPKAVTDRSPGAEGTVSLVAFPDQTVPDDRGRPGMRLVLVNRTDGVVAFKACDWRLYLVQEALAKDGTWQPVEDLPSSFCGNSYHRTFLGPDEYWEFAAPRYAGSFQTRLRFKLVAADTPELPAAGPWYSNEFEACIDPGQFRAKRH